MWICHNKAFMSIVEVKDNPTQMVVRFRRKNEAETIFPDKIIIISHDSDYRYRVYISREEAAILVARFIIDVNYSNFKDSVEDDELHDMYATMWGTHWYHQFDEPGRHVSKKSKKKNKYFPTSLFNMR